LPGKSAASVVMSMLNFVLAMKLPGLTGNVPMNPQPIGPTTRAAQIP
jgi:hypothetical protein